MSSDTSSTQICESNPKRLISFSSAERDFESASPIDFVNQDQPWDFITFLAAAQNLKIRFIPNCYSGAGNLGIGGTAQIRQNRIDVRTSFAFKAIKDWKWVESIDESERPQQIEFRLKALISEISILGQESIRRHANIISLEGVCWDILPSGMVGPVLVFEKTIYGDLWNFAESELGQAMSLEARLKLCADVALAIGDLHHCMDISLK